MPCGHCETLIGGDKGQNKDIENFEGLGRVVYARQNEGMGIHFTNIEPNDQLVLDKWIAERRDTREQK